MTWDGRCQICGQPVAVGATWAVGLVMVAEDVEIAGGVHTACLDELYADGGCWVCREGRKAYVLAGRYGGDPTDAASLMSRPLVN